MVWEIDLLCLLVVSYVAFGVSALLGHHQGASITSPTPTVVFLSSFHAFFLLAFCLFHQIPTVETFRLELLPGIPELPYSKWSRLTSVSFLMNKRESTTPRNHGALSVWFISTLLWGATAFCCCWLTTLLTVGGGHFDPKTPFICCSPFTCKPFLTNSTLKRRGSMGRDVEDSHWVMLPERLPWLNVLLIFFDCMLVEEDEESALDLAWSPMWRPVDRCQADPQVWIMRPKSDFLRSSAWENWQIVEIVPRWAQIVDEK
jgi:hypothetical protein